MRNPEQALAEIRMEGFTKEIRNHLLYPNRSREAQDTLSHFFTSENYPTGLLMLVTLLFFQACFFRYLNFCVFHRN